MRASQVLAATASAVLLSAGTAVALPPQWTTPERFDAENAVGRSLAVNAGGEAVFAASLDGPAQGQFHFIASIRQADGSWSAHRTLSMTGTSTGRPKAAMAPDGTAIVVWHELSPGGFERIRALWRVPGGDWETLAETVSATGQGAEVGSPSVAIGPGGRAVVVWPQGATVGSSAALVREGTRAGWAAIDDLSAPGVGALGPDVALDAAGGAVAVWRQSAAGSAGLWSAARQGGAAWPDPASAVQLASSSNGFRLAGAPNGDVIVGWVTNPPAGTEKDAWVRSRRGGTWAAGSLLSGQFATDATPPDVAVDATGRELAVWKQLTSPEDSGWMSLREPGPSVWTAPAPITADPGDGVYSSDGVLNGRGEAFVVWDGPFGATGLLRVPPGAAPGDPVPVAAQARAIIPVSDGSGNVAVNYTRSGTWSAVIDTTPPTLSLTQAPASAAPGEPLAFAATATDPWSGAQLAWDHGDGTSATGATTTHAFAAPGPFAVVARATDGVGNVATETVPVQVVPPPAAPTGGASTPPPGGAVSVPGGPVTGTPAAGRLVRRVVVLGRPRASARLRVRVTTARAGTVRLLLQRGTRAGFRTVARLRRDLPAGVTVLRFRGRAAGTYRVVAVAEGARTPARFRVRPRVP